MRAARESNGGTVALAAALREPDRFSRLVLVAAPHSNFDDPQTRAFVAQLRSDYDRTLAGFVELCLPEQDHRHLRRRLRQILQRAEPEAAARLVEAMYGLDLRPRLGQIDVPALVVHGALDPLPATRLAAARETAELIPGARLCVLDDAGHVPTLTHPNDVARLIEDFIDS